MPRSPKLAEGIQGRYAAFPHGVLDSTSFQMASHPARALLFDLMRQHTGSNNGRMNLSMKWLGPRGWTSCDVVQRAKTELVELGLILETKKGGLGIGPSLYAVTWLPISTYTGLDVQEGEYRRGAYALKNKVPAPSNGTARTVSRNRPVPSHGTGGSAAVPSSGAKKGVFAPSPVPSHGHYERVPLPQAAGGRPETTNIEYRPSLGDLIAQARAF
jgi:hypothetical protein